MSETPFDYITEDASIPEDSKSKKEEKTLLSANNKRKERIREVFNKIFIIILWIAFVLICLVLITRVIHIIVPDSLRWLSPEDIAQMDKFLFSSALGGLVGKYFNNIISDN